MGGVAVQDSLVPGEAQIQTKLAAKDLIMVSEYYSKMLVHFVRTVLEIIPEMMFKILAEIIQIQTDKFQEMPPRVNLLFFYFIFQLFFNFLFYFFFKFF